MDGYRGVFGMATKYAEGLLAIKYRTIDKDGHVLGGPFYYIENGMGKNWRWLAKIFAFFRSRCRPFRYRYFYAGKQYFVSGEKLL